MRGALGQKTEEEKANEKEKCAREVEEKANRKSKQREKGERASKRRNLSLSYTFDSRPRRPAISTLRLLSSSSSDAGAESKKRMQAKRNKSGKRNII